MTCVGCPSCNATGKVKKAEFYSLSNGEVEDVEIDCPVCAGTGDAIIRAKVVDK